MVEPATGVSDRAAFPELRKALLRWAQEAIQHLSSTGPTEFYGPQRWNRDDDGAFRNAPRLTQVWSHSAVAETMQTAKWREVEAELMRDDRLSSQLNTPIGTPMGSTRFDSDRAGRMVLPAFDEVDDFDTAFEARYARLDSFLAASDFERMVVWPIPGLLGDQFPISLEKTVEIDYMSDEELAIALNIGLTLSILQHASIIPEEEFRVACMRYHSRVPKVVGGALQTAGEHEIVERQLSGYAERLKQTLALVAPASVTIAGRFSREPHNPLGGWTNYSPAVVTRQQLARTLELDGPKTAELTETWLRLGHPTLPKALGLAARRLSYQAARERLEDELVDILVAAEALYLSDAGHNELSYRLALRAAAFSDPSQLGMTRLDVFTTMRSAYNVRSKIVHGDTPKATDLVVRGEAVSLPDFVRSIESILRQGLRQAVVLATAPTRLWPPDWDRLTLPAD